MTWRSTHCPISSRLCLRGRCVSVPGFQFRRVTAGTCQAALLDQTLWRSSLCISPLILPAPRLGHTNPNSYMKAQVGNAHAGAELFPCPLCLPSCRSADLFAPGCWELGSPAPLLTLCCLGLCLSNSPSPGPLALVSSPGFTLRPSLLGRSRQNTLRLLYPGRGISALTSP